MSYSLLTSGLPWTFPGVKAPGAYVDYSWDAADYLIPVNDAISTVSVKTSPWGPGEIVPSNLTVHGTIITVWLADGVPGRDYTIQIDVTTRDGRILEWPLGLLVDPTVCPYPFPGPPANTDFSTALTWALGNEMQNLPAVTVVATGTTQLTAAPVSLALVLINAGSGGSAPGIILPDKATFYGNIMWITNVSGGPATIYPYADNTIAGLTINMGTVIQDQQTAHVYVSETGFLVVS